ncbi:MULTISPECIES: YkvA family protein [unclassified Sinorhizobium]|uniref:YkvA family protein n=1 Tax=unclassified Sinorhizobium TaxID=2613772 RepID=UPI003526745F
MSERKSIFARLKQWARGIKRDVHALYLAARDPRTPWLAKVLAVAVAAYALSPIDLIPDFIPVLGYLDDIILLPIAIALVVRLIPEKVMEEHRAAAATAGERPISRAGSVAIVCIWIAVAALLLWLILQRYSFNLR